MSLNGYDRQSDLVRSSVNKLPTEKSYCTLIDGGYAQEQIGGFREPYKQGKTFMFKLTGI